jgi:hypothetical protein
MIPETAAGTGPEKFVDQLDLSLKQLLPTELLAAKGAFDNTADAIDRGILSELSYNFVLHLLEITMLCLCISLLENDFA